MLDETMTSDDLEWSVADKKRAAFEIVTDAMADAEVEGIEHEIVVQAALFAVFTDLVTCYGEDAVADLAEKLPARLRGGEFTLDRIVQ